MEKKSGVVIIEGHIQGLANLRALAKEGIPCIVVDKTDCIARHSKYCQGYFLCPDFIEDALADFLLQLAESENLNGWVLLPSNDHAVYTLTRNQNRLEKTYKFLTPPLNILEEIYDKSLLLNLANKLRLPIPKTEKYLSSRPQSVSLQFPVITKGRKGLTFYKKVGKKAIISRNQTELHSNLEKLAQTIPLNETFCQEVIPFDGTNKTISFTSFCIEGEIQSYWMGVKLREHPLQFGTATFCESLFQKECLGLSQSLLKYLNYTGVCEIEYLRDPRDDLYKLIEINARTWLWVGLAIACGVNFPLYIYNYLNGIPSNYASSYKLNQKWRNYWTDLAYSLQALIKGRISFRSYLLTVKGQHIIDAVRDEYDPKPFWAMTRSLARLFLSR